MKRPVYPESPGPLAARLQAQCLTAGRSRICAVGFALVLALLGVPSIFGQTTDIGQPESDQASLPGRITYQVPFPAEKGGGTATGSAGNVEYLRDDLVLASGGVELRYQDLKIQAQRVEVDIQTMMVKAEVDVIIDQGPRRLVGDSALFSLETKTGTVTNAKAFVDPDIFFQGEEVAKIGEDIYTVTKGTMSSCIDASPDWSVRLSHAQITVDGFARAKHARFKVKKLPVLYLPYFAYPANQDRKSGFLFPNLGYSNQRGANVGLAYFQTMGESFDATLFADFYGEDYLGLGTEVRYRPSQTTGGRLEAYAIDDPEEGEVRWKIFWDHISDGLPLGLRGVVRYEDFSDFNFFRDFERDFNQASVRRLRSAGYLTGSWGQHSFTLLVDDNTTFLSSGSELSLRQLPEAEYRLRAFQLGRLPLYLEALGSANYFSIGLTDEETSTYGRVDLFPQLRAALSTIPWLSVTVVGGVRATSYTDSLDEEDRTQFSGEGLTRTFTTAGATVVGPSVTRVFNGKIGRFNKFKHIVEPRWNYGFVDGFDDQNLVPNFDQVDILRPFNVLTFSFVNRLLAKPEDEALHGGAREIMSFEVSQRYSFKGDQPLQVSRDRTQESLASPITARFRWNPSQLASVESRATYNTLFSNLTNASISGGVKVGQHSFGLTWFTNFNAESGDTIGNQIRFFTGVQVWPTHLRIDAQLNYDFERSLLQSQRYIVQYFSQCWGLRFELREFTTTLRTDRDFRFALSLKNIGTFLDLTGGTRNGFNPGIF